MTQNKGQSWTSEGRGKKKTEFGILILEDLYCSCIVHSIFQTSECKKKISDLVFIGSIFELRIDRFALIWKLKRHIFVISVLLKTNNSCVSVAIFIIMSKEHDTSTDIKIIGFHNYSTIIDTTGIWNRYSTMFSFALYKNY